MLDTASDLFGGDKKNPYHLQFVEGCCAYLARTLNCAVLICEHDSGMAICNDRVCFLSRSEEIKDERMLYCGKSSHLLRYQDNVFVI